MNKTGFGFLRPPWLGPAEEKQIDYTKLNRIVDRFLELGGTVFDTAYTYLGGLSEEAIRKSLVERHPRDRYVLVDKLPGYLAKADCQAYFDESLRRCGVTYFDRYLLHWLTAENYAIAEQYDQFRFLREIKAAGKAGKIGFSYHDSPELLDKILTDHPEVDCVLLQINYLDWDSVSLRARACYETAVRHGVSVMVMEPVKGGSLANLPAEAEQCLRDIRPADSAASWAIRFAADLDAVDVVLSGMNTMEQLEDNLRDLPPLTEADRDALTRAAEIIRSNTAVACTGCGYCVPHCPLGMPIPQYFTLYNEYARHPGEDWKMQYAYNALAERQVKASACADCKQCEAHCPQNLEIAAALAKTAAAFEG